MTMMYMIRFSTSSGATMFRPMPAIASFFLVLD
jgi:hypothetical protein